MTQQRIIVKIYQRPSKSIIKIACINEFDAERSPDLFYTLSTSLTSSMQFDVEQNFSGGTYTFFGEETPYFSTTFYGPFPLPCLNEEINGSSDELIRRITASGSLIYSCYSLLRKMGFPENEKESYPIQCGLDCPKEERPQKVDDLVYYLSKIKLGELERYPHTKETPINTVINKKHIFGKILSVLGIAFGITLFASKNKIDFNSNNLKNHYKLFSSVLGGCLLSLSFILLILICSFSKRKTIKIEVSKPQPNSEFLSGRI